MKKSLVPNWRTCQEYYRWRASAENSVAVSKMAARSVITLKTLGKFENYV